MSEGETATMSDEARQHYERRMASFTSTMGSVANQIDKYRLVSDYNDIFDLEVVGADGYGLCLVQSGVASCVARLIANDVHHTTDDHEHVQVLAALFALLGSIHAHIPDVLKHASLPDDLIAACRVLVDRTANRPGMKSTFRDLFAFCVNAILSIFVGDGEDMWGGHRSRLELISPDDITTLALSNLLRSGVRGGKKKKRKVLNKLVTQNSLLLIFAVSSRAESIPSRLALRSQAMVVRQGQALISLRIQDYFSFAPSTTDPANTFSVAAILLYVIMLDQSIHQTVIESYLIIDTMMQSFWAVMKVSPSQSVQTAIVDRMLMATGRLIPLVQTSALRLAVGSALLRLGILSALASSLMHPPGITSQESRCLLFLNSPLFSFVMNRTRDPDLIDAVQPEWYNIWTRFERYFAMEDRIDSSQELQMWAALGSALNITVSDCRKDWVAPWVSNGCSWYRCPLYGCEDLNAHGVEMMRCMRCQAAYYCTRACQKRDWQDGDHAGMCRKAAAGDNPVADAQS